jgi:hypothetical protein
MLLPLLAGAAWIGRNLQSYGEWEAGRAATYALQHPIGLLPGFQVTPVPDHVPGKHPYLYAAANMPVLLRSTFMSFWGVFGNMGLLMPAAYYVAWSLVCLAAAAGLWIGIRRLPPGELERRPQGLLLLAYLAIFGVIFAGYVYTTLFAPLSQRANFQPQGRYLFGALLPLLTFVVLGLRELLAARGGERWLAPACAGVALAANAWCLAVVASAPWARLTWTGG